MSNRAYDVLKFVAQIILPALGTAIYGLSAAWGGWEWAEPVVGTITVIDAFLGAVLGISTAQYYKAKGAEDETDR